MEAAKFSKIFEKFLPPSQGGGQIFSKILENFRKFSKIPFQDLTKWKPQSFRKFSKNSPPPGTGAQFLVFFFENPLSGPDEVETAKFSKIFEKFPPPPKEGGKHFRKFSKIFENFRKKIGSRNKTFSKIFENSPLQPRTLLSCASFLSFLLGGFKEQQDKTERKRLTSKYLICLLLLI